MVRGVAAAMLGLLLACAVMVVLLRADKEDTAGTSLLARSSPPSIPPSGSAYRETMRMARRADLYRQAAFDDAVEDQDKKVEKDEKLAMKIEEVDKKKSREREVKTLLDIAKARNKAAEMADKQLDKRAEKLQTDRAKDAKEPRHADEEKKPEHASEQRAKAVAGSVKRMATEAYQAYQDDLKEAERRDKKRQESFMNAKKEEEKEDKEDDDDHQRQLAMGRRKRKLWWWALKREEKRDLERKARWKQDLTKAEKMMESIQQGHDSALTSSREQQAVASERQKEGVMKADPAKMPRKEREEKASKGKEALRQATELVDQARSKFLEADAKHQVAMDELKKEEQVESLKKQNDWKTILSKSSDGKKAREKMKMKVKLSLETVKKRQRELAEAVNHQVGHAHVQFWC
ncbi:hypothetical protein GUITHDRAFT_146691 [Guillardia theta CCMP2712]|uniref:Trichohyalin-plectin-homology domain-containing protein n=1 Tax=Guillardia theta (strain CCMP2712) TaxID=905079 RepID=L1IH91_GUITC|nr:hypothetical protein GUITHDRAFT_146691 [Guillardia theta CCMP2712]EKX35195.1 hypothetical protein GUITHDRAFT_146691 [Guillardia theta CCMP2712]|eukprot:XP_005822175.1 hypothetical protein GUITHDRAFT_146691 [Guillardia theta CCMP2712]